GLEHTHSSSSFSPPAEARWEGLLDVLLDVLHLPAVYILLDGLDGVGETADDPAAAVYCLSSLMPFIPEWTKRRVYFKAFIPIETRPILEREYPIIIEASQIVALEWTPALLAEVVRRRVYVASEGAYGSLGPLASPDIRDIETVLAKASLPLPREILVLTRRVLFERARRTGISPKLQSEDVEFAIQWYQGNKPQGLKITDCTLSTVPRIDSVSFFGGNTYE
ncbi:MAG: hypothetical protein KKD28_12870, partial [Chloroflexi bacterium]|nr:hypothetical protein [Chloroflexota bacterium]